MAGCTSNEAPVTDEGLWKDARPTGASLPYPRDTPTIIARHRTAGTSQQDDLGTAVSQGWGRVREGVRRAAETVRRRVPIRGALADQLVVMLKPL